MTTAKKDTPQINTSQKFMLPILSIMTTLLAIDIVLLGMFNIGLLKFNISAQTDRTENIYEYDPDLGWKLRPLYNGLYQWDDGSYTFWRTNPDGWRDLSYPMKKPDNVYRIAAIGCSRTFGYGVNMQESYPKVLENILGQRIDDNIEVMNFGVNGYGLDQMALNYSKNIRKYDPDLVILQLYGPSILRTYYTRIWRTNKPTFKMINNKLKLVNHPVPENSKGRFSSFFMERSPLFRLLSESLLKIENNKKAKLERILSKDKKLHSLNTEILKHLKNNVEADGKKLIVFIWGEDSAWIRTIVENAGAEVFALEDHADINAWKKKGSLENAPPTGHWSPLGNQYVAEALFQYLLKKGQITDKIHPFKK